MPSARLGALLLATSLGFGAGIGGMAALPGVASATPSEEACFLAAINALRTATGVPPVSLSPSLSSIAAAHSQQMASVARLFHNPDLASEVPAGWVAIGENVGAGPSCDSVTTLIAGDPDHRQNLLDSRFDAVGVGVVDTAGGTLYATEDFIGSGLAPPVAVPITEPDTVEVPTVDIVPVQTPPDASQAPAVVTSKAVLPTPAGSHRTAARAAGAGRIPIAVPIVVAEPASIPATAPARGILAPVVRDLTTFFAGLS